MGSLGERDQAALQRFRRNAVEQAQKAAQALGYYQARIRGRVTDDKVPTLRINVRPGEPVHLRNVTVRVDGPAAKLKSFRVPGGDSLKPGAQLNHGAYEDAKRLIQNQASRFGFFRGQFTQQQLRIDPEAGVADIELVYASGPRYRLGKVDFAGDFPFDEDLLQRMVPFKEGSDYDSEQIADLNQALQSSGYFDGVRVDAAPTNADGEVVPVHVHLEARKPRTMGLGLGFSTDVGPRARATWTRHWVNPQGHSLGFEAEVSAPRQNVGAWYEIPLDPPLTDKLRFTSGYQYEDLVDTESKLLTLGGEWHHKLDSGWQRVVSLNWQREEYKLGDDSGLSSFLMPGIGYSILEADNKIDPGKGYRLQFEVKGAKEGLLADADVAHINAMAKGVTSFWGGQRLLGRIQVAASPPMTTARSRRRCAFSLAATRACVATTTRRCRRRIPMATALAAATWSPAASNTSIPSPSAGASPPRRSGQLLQLAGLPLDQDWRRDRHPLDFPGRPAAPGPRRRPG